MKQDTEQNIKRPKLIRNINILLLILVLLAVLAIVAFYVYIKIFAPKDVPTVKVPDNIIGGQSSPADDPSGSQTSQPSETYKPVKVSMSFIGDKQLGEESLNVSNLFPGDSVQRNYGIRFVHEKNLKVKMYFVPEENSSVPLQDNMKIRILLKEGNALLCDLTFGALVTDGFYFYIEETPAKQSSFTFAHTLYLPESAGNECANQALCGKLVWEATDIDHIPNDDHPVIIPPKTGDSFSSAIYICMVSLCGALLFALWLSKRTKRDLI